MPKPIATLALIAFALTAAASTAFAAPFEVYSEITGSLIGLTRCTDAGAASASCSDGVPGPALLPGHANATAGASPGRVTASGDVELSGTRSTRRTESGALMRYTDFNISGPDGATSVSGPLMLDVHGLLDAHASILSGTPIARTELVVLLEAAVETPSGTMPFRRGRMVLTADTRDSQRILHVTGDFTNTGSQPSTTSDFPFVSLPFLMPVGRDFQVEVFLRADVQSDIMGEGTASTGGRANFASSATFPKVGPVFDLPDGYTVDSVSAQIVDNRWIGDQPIGVPEPGTLSLLAAGVTAGMLGRKLRRRAG